MSRLSKAVQGLILAGASSVVIFSQFLDEKEGNRLNAYRDGSGSPTICRGLTVIDGKPVVMGMTLTAAQCDRFNLAEAQKALALVERYITVPLSEPQKAGVASFCAYNIGIGKCRNSTFFRKMNAGDRAGACHEISKWIFDGGKDCRIRANNCAGQPERREAERELCLTD